MISLRLRQQRLNAPKKAKTEEQLNKIQKHQKLISSKLRDRIQKFESGDFFRENLKPNDPVDPIGISSKNPPIFLILEIDQQKNRAKFFDLCDIRRLFGGTDQN